MFESFEEILAKVLSSKIYSCQATEATAPTPALNIQSWTLAYVRLLKESYVNGVPLREQNQTLESLVYFRKGIRSFHARNIGSIGQRARKLLEGVQKKVHKRFTSYHKND